MIKEQELDLLSDLKQSKTNTKYIHDFQTLDIRPHRKVIPKEEMSQSCVVAKQQRGGS